MPQPPFWERSLLLFLRQLAHAFSGGLGSLVVECDSHQGAPTPAAGKFRDRASKSTFAAAVTAVRFRCHLITEPYFPERNDSTVFCASARFGEKRATRSEIAVSSSNRPSCRKACANSKYPTSVGCTATAREYWRMASVMSPFSWAIKPSPVIALAQSGSNCSAVSKHCFAFVACPIPR